MCYCQWSHSWYVPAFIMASIFVMCLWKLHGKLSLCVKSVIGLYRHSAAMATVIKLIGWNVSISLPNSWDWNSKLFSPPSLHHPQGSDDDMWPGTRSGSSLEAHNERVEMRKGRIRASEQIKQISLGASSSCDFPSFMENEAFVHHFPPVIGRAKWPNSFHASPFFPLSWLLSKRGVEALPSFGLVMSSGDFVVLKRLDGSVPLKRRCGEQPAEQPCAPLSKSS